MPNPKVAFLAIARSTFDLDLAVEVRDLAYQSLGEMPLNILWNGELITDQDFAANAVSFLNDNPPDLLLIFQATFADSSMVIELAQNQDVPIVLWAVPEEHTGDRLRLNSFCGINLAAHGLKRAGIPYDYIFAPPDEPAALNKIRDLAKAGQIRNQLRKARLGRIGENPSGFDTCLFDPDLIRKTFGVELIQFDLKEEFFPQVSQVDPDQVQQVQTNLAQKVEGLDDLDQTATKATLSSYVAMKAISERKDIGGFAVRCWPEFFTELGCAACGAMSMLSDELIPCSCEADVNGTITQMLLQSVSETPAFGTDIVSLDETHDAIVIWHCGLAPLSMADPQKPKGVTIHSNRRLPLLFEFTLKPGQVTIARLSEASGEYRLVLGLGEIISGPKSFSGTSGLLKFDRPAREILENILEEGLEHHISLTYGNHTDVLSAYAKLINIPVLLINKGGDYR